MPVRSDIDKGLVTLIIPTYNSGRTIAIVVDNCSTDDTLQVVAKTTAIAIVMISSMSQARNMGALRAKGEFLFHVDSDMELSPRTVEGCVSSCESDNSDAVIVPEVSVGKGYWAGCIALGKTLVLGLEGYEGVRFVTRKAFEATRGYDSNLVAGEDFDFYRRLLTNGFRISRANSVILHHVGQVSLGAILAKYGFYAGSVARFRAKYPNRQDQAPFIRLLRNRWQTFVGDPIHAVGYLFLMLMAYAIQK